MRVKTRNYGILAAALFPAIVLAVMGNGYQSGNVTWNDYWPMAAFCVAAMVVIALSSLGKTVFSETGITKQYLWVKKHYQWDHVIQAGIIKLETAEKRFAFTFSGGIPWEAGKTIKWWAMNNGSKCLSAKYSDELRELILRCYGPLDFQDE